jgi:uncharacterized protein (DUF488 family)
MTIYTIGHSNRSLEDFLALLRAHSIERLVDIRSVPKSRHNPHFNREVLAASLPAAGIEYRHMPGLGGLRHPRKDSTNLAWRNDSFRGYADYMQTYDFDDALAHLIAPPAPSHRTAIMCAEAVPWRCHRSLVADSLTVRGFDVRHIMSPTSAEPHKLTPFAQVDGIRVTYPGILPPD